MKNVKDKLCKLKNVAPNVYMMIINDLQTLQSGAVDKESFVVLYDLLKKKWLESYENTDEKVIDLLKRFFEYFTKFWVESEESEWYQAATNNNLEATNQVFKKEYTARTKLWIPNLFKKIKDQIWYWSKRDIETEFDPDRVPVNLLNAAEELREECNENNLLLSKKTRPYHRNLVRQDSGIVRGTVKETNIVPLKPDMFKMSKQEFGVVGQQIHSRMTRISYTSFDEFKSDIESIAMVETVLKQENGSETFIFACSCNDKLFPSGVKGKICVHVVLAHLVAGNIKTRAQDRRISNAHNKKGPGRKNEKQNY